MRNIGGSLLAAFALAAASCSALTTMYSTPGPQPAVRPLPVAGTDLFDWKGIVHCHSYLSHDSDGTIEEIAAACRTARIDFVAMTDHQTDASIRDGARGMIGDTLFMVGAEIRTPQGTIQAFPLTQPLRHWQHAGLIAREAHRQGAIVLVCHGELWPRWDVPELDGAEIVNLHAGAMTRGYAGTLGAALFLPVRILFERICMRDDRVFAQWDGQLAVRHPFAPVGGNDAHANVKVFGPLGGTIGTYQEVFLTLSTHVLAKHLEERAIVDAIKLGRTYVSFDIFGEGAGFDFRAVDADGVHVVGSTVPASPALRLLVRTPGPGSIELWRNGAKVREVTADAFEQTGVEPGLYRVEVRTTLGSPWLFSSSILVTPGQKFHA